ncbi:MAG: DNA polymerase III subunit gamma/tau [Clostridia bacterium]|nr:DNA polymerase III subunit gamma/tau [Clostridia bacterium]
MHQALYRKYRPSVFDDVYGQEHITSILRQEAMRGSVSHAYLFSGSRGTGKTTCAKILAKSVNCLNPKDGNPCNECENCRAIDSGNTTDVIEMDAATNTGVDYIRDLRENVMYTPAMLKKRVYIIDEAHMLSDSAFNALLKTIEEPPEHVIYIFATTEQHKIPATIISRCQRFEFRRIAMRSLVERLMYIASVEGIELTSEGASLIAKTAQGGMRDAISLMELCAGPHKEITAELVNEILGTSSYDKMCTVAKNIAEKNYAKLFEAINEIVISSKDILVFFADLTAFYRDMLVHKSGVAESYLELLPAEMKLLEECASLFNIATLIYHSTLLDEAYNNMLRNPTSKRLCAEITMMKMCDPKLSDSSEAILSRLSALEDRITLLSKGAISVGSVYEEEPQSEQMQEEIKQEVEEIKKTSLEPSTSSQPSSVSTIECWDDVITKATEKDAAVGSFLKGSVCYRSEKNNKFYLITGNSFAERMLLTEKSKKCVFDAMLLCDIDIANISQLQITSQGIKSIVSDLDEFE